MDTVYRLTVTGKEEAVERVFGNMRIARRKSLLEEVYDSLRKSILHGKLKGGERLIEEQLAHQIGISRTPIREAFHKLERDELVTRLPKGGFAVREFTKEDVEEIFGIRSALESYAVLLATSHISPERISILEKKIEETEKAMKNRDRDKVIHLHTEFHDLLYKSCKSNKLIEMINNFRDYFYRYRPALLRNEKTVRDSIEDHRQMLGAMKKKNPRLVEKLVRNHLRKGKEIILKEIDRGETVP
ncbi:MAG: GntR family transcriptional regulator [Thermodesulfobacteriota bacterium]